MSENQSAGLFWRAWTVPKAGNTPDQNEDALSVQALQLADGTGLLLVAVADGATEAVYSSQWARKLVTAAEPDWPTLDDEALTRRLDQVRQAFSPFKADEQTPWYIRNKYLTQGSQATLMVVTVAGTPPSESLSIRAVSIGDCCLLLFKASGEIFTFPVRTSNEFGSIPILVRSRPGAPLHYNRWEIQTQPGDFLLACTDAVAKWSLQCIESNQVILLVDMLIRLLARPSPEFRPMTTTPSDIDSASESSPGKQVQDQVAGQEEAEQISPLRRLRMLVRRLWPRERPDEPAEENPQIEIQRVTSLPVLPLEFEEIVERHRAPGGEPRMRNDDSTLILCVPVRSSGESRLEEALETLRRQPSIHPPEANASVT